MIVLALFSPFIALTLWWALCKLWDRFIAS